MYAMHMRNLCVIVYSVSEDTRLLFIHVMCVLVHFTVQKSTQYLNTWLE